MNALIIEDEKAMEAAFEDLSFGRDVLCVRI